MSIESIITEILFHFKNMGASEDQLDEERTRMLEDNNLIYKNMQFFDKKTQDTIIFMANADELIDGEDNGRL